MSASPAVRRGSWATDVAALLAQRSPEAGEEFFRVVAELPPGCDGVSWARTAVTLCHGNRKSDRLATLWIRAGPALADLLAPSAVARLGELIGAVAERSHETAVACLQCAPAALASLAGDDREPFLRFVSGLARTTWPDALTAFERAPDRLAGVAPGLRAALLDVLGRAPSRSLALLDDTAGALAGAEAGLQRELLDAAGHLADVDPAVGLELLRTAPVLSRRVDLEALRRWTETGTELLLREHDPERAAAWFRLDTSAPRRMLTELTTGVELADVAPTLELYAHALAGVAIPVRAAAAGAEDAPGAAIRLPPLIDRFDDRASNFAAYKVAVTHEVGRLEFGSYDYPSQRLFACFADRRLIAGLFRIVEDTRIDSCVAREYPGIRAALQHVRSQEAERRPEMRAMPHRRALVEGLLRASLGRPDTVRAPAGLSATVARCVALLETVRRPGATAHDSGKVAAELYDVVVRVPNVRGEPREPAETGEVAYEDPAQPEFRGDFQPELAQVLTEPGPEEPAATSDTTATLEEPPKDVAGTIWQTYDEWDVHAGGYRPAWCRVGERRADEDGPEWYEATLRRHHALVVQTRRQFELMRPESFRRTRRLEDGHEIDLDHAVEFHVDKRAGAGPQARFYSRRDKVERDVAVALLVDVSGSTAEPLPLTRDQARPRVVDLVKEATVLFVEALEAIGDTYAVYAFSGYGRHNVEILVVKDLHEPLDDRTRGRIGELEPRRSTRMGAAIRHAITKLHADDAKAKLLVLVSDGRPQDQGYGRDRDDLEYPAHDTRQALLEARRIGIVPFLVTVDRDGHDYLRDMCGGMGYEVIADIESLPRRLTALYRCLAGK